MIHASLVFLACVLGHALLGYACCGIIDEFGESLPEADKGRVYLLFSIAGGGVGLLFFAVCVLPNL